MMEDGIPYGNQSQDHGQAGDVGSIGGNGAQSEHPATNTFNSTPQAGQHGVSRVQSTQTQHGGLNPASKTFPSPHYVVQHSITDTFDTRVQSEQRQQRGLNPALDIFQPLPDVMPITIRAQDLELLRAMAKVSAIGGAGADYSFQCCKLPEIPLYQVNMRRKNDNSIIRCTMYCLSENQACWQMMIDLCTSVITKVLARNVADMFNSELDDISLLNAAATVMYGVGDQYQFPQLVSLNGVDLFGFGTTRNGVLEEVTPWYEHLGEAWRYMLSSMCSKVIRTVHLAGYVPGLPPPTDWTR